MSTQSKVYEKDGLLINTEITPHDDGLCTLEISVTNGTKEQIEKFLEELAEATKDMDVKFNIHTGKIN
ncbi:hypothetical protein NFI00_000198 [Salmonella enterica]|nr:hypothetical protein [Salmonella enterica]